MVTSDNADTSRKTPTPAVPDAPESFDVSDPVEIEHPPLNMNSAGDDIVTGMDADQFLQMMGKGYEKLQKLLAGDGFAIDESGLQNPAEGDLSGVQGPTKNPDQGIQAALAAEREREKGPNVLKGSEQNGDALHKPTPKPEGCDIAREIPHNRTKSRPVPEDTESVTPSETAITDATSTLQELGRAGSSLLSHGESPISETAQSAMQALVNGNMTQLQDVLKRLEKDPNGKDNLTKLAGELTQLLNTTVEASDLNGQFSLDFLTTFQNATVGGYSGMTREAEGHLSVSSSGEVKAGRKTDLGYATQETEMNTKTETTRLQALAVNELQDIVMQARQNAAIEANGVIQNIEKTLKGPFEQKIRTNPAMPVRTPPLPQAPIRR